MTVKTDPPLVRNLIDYLAECADVVVERVAADEVAVSFLAACRPANEEFELELRLRAWCPCRASARPVILRAA